ncbi:MAG: molybdenum hydroxylase [Spirochaetae bacterium HGW-Spirochaetae-3]|jgi:xanthine dehydrogenase accessory factor|nr:MAG: molybdenum hydroxylase [Spirochaetae bacterium HGW-Spirochaetae-3]
MELFSKAAELAERNIPFAIATIVQASGSTPRGKAKMLVLSDGACFGTVGGGVVEARVVAEARRAIALNRPVMLDYSLDDSADGGAGLPMECGGAMKVFVEVIGARPRLLVVGAGHVGLAIAEAAARVGYRIAVVDDRPGFATAERLSMAAELYVDADLGAALGAAPVDSGTCVVVATSAHSSDQRAIGHFVDSGCRYLGVLGSRRKVAAMFERLRSEGVSEESLAKVRAPIGLDLGAETPEEIAVSVVSEIMAAIAGRDAAPLSGRDGELVAVRGAGDLATGVIVRLKASGFRVVALEIEKPTAIRRAVSLSEADYDGEAMVEGVVARRVDSLAAARSALADGVVPVLVDPDCRFVASLAPYAVVDATLAGRSTVVRRGMAPAVIALGPGFEAGGDADAVVETRGGPDLGRVILSGSAAEDPVARGEIGGDSDGRVLESPEQCARISGDARAVAGGVLEAILALKGRVKRRG